MISKRFPSFMCQPFLAFYIQRGEFHHLGNVRAVISDVKNPINMAMPISNWTFTAEIRNLNNYYPYGMELPGGGYASIGNYGYGYNGMEKDDELKGSGKVMNYEARLYSTDGTFFSLDPKMFKYPMLSPYIFGNNNPIKYLDFDGREFNRGNTMTEEGYKATIEAMKTRNIYVFNYANNLKFNPETQQFVENPEIIEDPSSDKYVNYTNVVFELNVENLDEMIRDEELKGPPIKDGALNGQLEYSSAHVLKINPEKNRISYSTKDGSEKSIGLENYELGTIAEVAMLISFDYAKDFQGFELFMPVQPIDNSLTIKITFDDYIDDSGDNEFSKRGKVGNHEIGHFRFAFSSVFNRILSQIYLLIDKEAKGHNEGNPDGEAAIEAEIEIK